MKIPDLEKSIFNQIFFSRKIQPALLVVILQIIPLPAQLLYIVVVSSGFFHLYSVPGWYLIGFPLILFLLQHYWFPRNFFLLTLLSSTSLSSSVVVCIYFVVSCPYFCPLDLSLLFFCPYWFMHQTAVCLNVDFTSMPITVVSQHLHICLGELRGRVERVLGASPQLPNTPVLQEQQQESHFLLRSKLR